MWLMRLDKMTHGKRWKATETENTRKGKNLNPEFLEPPLSNKIKTDSPYQTNNHQFVETSQCGVFFYFQISEIEIAIGCWNITVGKIERASPLIEDLKTLAVDVSILV